MNLVVAPAVTPRQTLVDVIQRWQFEGALHRIPTGIAPIDRLCGSGFPFPWRVSLVGAPSAGKTFVAAKIAYNYARAGVAVGLLCVDEDDDDITVRFAQMAGYSIQDTEQRDRGRLHTMITTVQSLPVALYDATWTIEGAADDLKKFADGRYAALFVDSVQTARSEASALAQSMKETVERNVAAIKYAAVTHRMLVVSTSEANRASYRSRASAEEHNPLAAGAESRSIEFGNKTVFNLNTPKDEADVIHVNTVKNKRHRHGEFWLRLDFARHELTECEAPKAGGDSGDDARAKAKRVQAMADAQSLTKLLQERRGLSEKELRSAAGAKLGFGVGRLDAAKEVLRGGFGTQYVLVQRGAGKKFAWFVEPNPAFGQTFPMSGAPAANVSDTLGFSAANVSRVPGGIPVQSRDVSKVSDMSGIITGHVVPSPLGAGHDHVEQQTTFEQPPTTSTATSDGLTARPGTPPALTSKMRSRSPSKSKRGVRRPRKKTANTKRNSGK